ncbi:MAG: SH3 domain-containing protein [Chloroflexota bacterium]
MKKAWLIFPVIASLSLPSMACAFAAWQPYAAMKAPLPTVSPAPSMTMDPQPAAAAARSSCTVTAESLNLRAGPGTAYPVLTWLSAGQVLTVLEAGPWLEVQTAGGLTGYVNSNYCKGQ